MNEEGPLNAFQLSRINWLEEAIACLLKFDYEIPFCYSFQS